MFENRTLREMLRCKTKEITGDWNQRLVKSYIIYKFVFAKYKDVFKSWLGHVAHLEEMGSALKTWSENTLGNLRMNGRIILKLILDELLGFSQDNRPPLWSSGQSSSS
jgi:hypothetical protein